MAEISWKDKLRLAWFGSFLRGASISSGTYLCGRVVLWE